MIHNLFARLLAVVLVLPAALMEIASADESKKLEEIWAEARTAFGVGAAFTEIPPTEAMRIQALGLALEGIEKYQPSIELIEETWKKAGREEELDLEKIKLVRDYLQQEKFKKDNEAAFDKINKAALNSIYAKMVDAGSIPKKAGSCLIFVPIPCPSLDLYKKSEDFMMEACAQAKASGGTVVIVRSPFGQKDLLEKADNWIAGENSAKLPTKFEAHIKNGVARVVDEIPGGHGSPWGFLFKDGKLVAEDNIATWAKTPLPILKQFSAK